MPKNIDEIIQESKDFLKSNYRWDNENRRTPNILIGKLIQFEANKNPQLRLSQIFLSYGIDSKDIEFNTESKEIWDKIKNSDYFQFIESEFLNYIKK